MSERATSGYADEWVVGGYADGWVVPGYAEERELGRGPSGRVVAAVREANGQRVVIRYLGPKLFRDPEFLADFRAEARVLMSLDTPQVVRLFSYVEEPGEGAAVVMELVNGVSLREIIARQGAASPESALAVLKGSLLGLAAAHGLRIAHRDYKPENVLVDDRGNSKLSNFGLAVKEGKRMPAAGTALYMAPEQWEGAPASWASDIYAATAVFFECLTGKTPFSGRLGQLRRQHLTATVPLGQVDEPLRGLIARGMAKNPRNRPVNAMAFVAELEETALGAYGPAWEERGRRQLRERAVALLPLLGPGVGGGAGASWFGSHKRAVFAGSAVAAMVLVGGAAAAAQGVLHHSQNSQQTAASKGSGSVPMHGKAAVTVVPPAVTSSCIKPTTFTYTGNVTASAAGSVSYRWVYSSGKPGPVRTLRFSKPGTMQVTGGTVKTKATGTGWAAIQMVSPAAGSSNKATYRLVCSATPASVTASAAVTPATDKVSCSSAAPSLTFTGDISDSKAGRVTYYWELPTGNGPTETVDFTKAGSLPVTSATVAAPSDSATGSGIIVITSPTAASSNVASFSVTCTQPAATTHSPTPATSRSPHPTTPAPHRTTASPHPTTPSPSPTTPSPSPTTPSPSPTTPSPKPTTPSPNPTISVPIPTTIPSLSITSSPA